MKHRFFVVVVVVLQKYMFFLVLGTEELITQDASSKSGLVLVHMSCFAGELHILGHDLG